MRQLSVLRILSATAVITMTLRLGCTTCKADIINKSGYTYVVLGSAISYSQAKARVSAGKSVFTVTKAEARNLARNFGGVVGPEIGRKSLGQYWHYHVNNRKNKAHIFYIF